MCRLLCGLLVHWAPEVRASAGAAARRITTSSPGLLLPLLEAFKGCMNEPSCVAHLVTVCVCVCVPCCVLLIFYKHLEHVDISHTPLGSALHHNCLCAYSLPAHELQSWKHTVRSAQIPTHVAHTCYM